MQALNEYFFFLKSNNNTHKIMIEQNKWIFMKIFYMLTLKTKWF